jgi:hypothetical protein
VEGQEINVEARELISLGELGRGAFGVVEKMKHTPSNTIMAVKASQEFCHYNSIISQYLSSWVCFARMMAISVL